MSAPKVGYRSMTKNGKRPLNAAQKRPPQTNQVEDNDNVRETPASAAQETIYVDDEVLPDYECVELTTTGSESPQYLDPNSLDEDSHKECGLGGYKNCSDNPANYSTARYQEDNFDENHPDPSDRGIT